MQNLLTSPIIFNMNLMEVLVAIILATLGGWIIQKIGKYQLSNWAAFAALILFAAPLAFFQEVITGETFSYAMTLATVLAFVGYVSRPAPLLRDAFKAPSHATSGVEGYRQALYLEAETIAPLKRRKLKTADIICLPDLRKAV